MGRAPCDTKVVGAKVEANGKGRAGLMCSIGDTVVTSSAWRCTDEKKELVGKRWKDNKFSTKAFDASLWPAAVELGRNEGEGTEPWGQIPAIAEKAFWIYTHDTYKEDNTKAKCRIDLVNEAFQTYSKENVKADRWSCKSDGKDRQSPFSITLDHTSLSMSAVSVNEEDGSDKKAAVSSGTSQIAFGGPSISQWRHKQRGRIGYRRHRGWSENSIVPFASLAIDEKKKVYPKSSILIRFTIPKIVDKSMEGAMAKKANLRLYVTDASRKPFYYCKSNYYLPTNTNYKQFNITYFNHLVDCRIAYARKVDEFVALDITDWMRDWVNGFGGKSIAILFDGGPPRGKDGIVDAVGFATTEADIQTQRPRLSLSCHGDRVQPIVVFKEKKVEFKGSSDRNSRKISIESKDTRKVKQLSRVASLVKNK